MDWLRLTKPVKAPRREHRPEKWVPAQQHPTEHFLATQASQADET